jgi:hypothetical protein
MSVRCDFSSSQIGNSESNLLVFSWSQPTWSDELSIETLMAMIRGLTSFPIVSMIMMFRMMEIIVISTYRIVALRISFPMVFEWSKLGLKRAKTVEITEFPLNRSVQMNWAVCNSWTRSLKPRVES